MLSRIFSEPLMSVSNKHNYKTFAESCPGGGGGGDPRG